jgi:O-antigen ligase
VSSVRARLTGVRAASTVKRPSGRADASKVTLVEPSPVGGPARTAVRGRAPLARRPVDQDVRRLLEHGLVAALLLLVVAPLAHAGGGRDGGAAAWAALLVVPALVVTRPWARLPARGLVLVAAVVVAALLVLPLSGVGRAGAVAALTYGVALGTGVVVAAYARTPARRAAVAGLLCAGGVAQFAWGLVPWWGAGDPTQPMVGTYFWHNQFAAALVAPALLGLALAIAGRRPWRSAGWVAAPLGVAGVVLSTSRATLGLLVLGWLAVVAMSWWRAEPGRDRSGVGARALVATLVAVGLTAVLPGPPLFATSASPLAGANARSASGETVDANGAYRTQFWREAVVVFREHPLAGAGYGRIAADAGGHVPATWAVSSLAHSGPLQALGDGGLLLAVPLVLLLAGTALALLRRLRPRGDPDGADMVDRALVPASVVASFALALHALVDIDWSYPALAAQAAAVAGLALALPAGRRAGSRAGGRIAVAALAVALVAGSAVAWGQEFHINAPASQTTQTAAPTSGGGHS